MSDWLRLWAFWNIPSQYTLTKLGVPLPIALPFSDVNGLIPFDDTMDKIHFVVSKAAAGTKDSAFTCQTRKQYERIKHLLHSQLSVAMPRTRWPTSTTGNTSRSCRCLATKSWLRTARTSWNSLFCWTTITSNRNTLMWRSLTCECAWQQQINHQIPFNPHQHAQIYKTFLTPLWQRYWRVPQEHQHGCESQWNGNTSGKPAIPASHRFQPYF